MMQQWTRSDTLALAFQRCTICRGGGMRIGRKGALHPCNCVLRAIFRICYNRFRYCQEKERSIPPAQLERGECGGARHRRYGWGRKDEEFAADFYLVSKRTLHGVEWDLFRFHFLLGADWKLCCRRTGLDRGVFFHSIYRIEQKLGRRFRELEPHALFPLDEYFGGKTRRDALLEEWDYLEAQGEVRPPEFVCMEDPYEEDPAPRPATGSSRPRVEGSRRPAPVRAPLRNQVA